LNFIIYILSNFRTNGQRSILPCLHWFVY